MKIIDYLFCICIFEKIPSIIQELKSFVQSFTFLSRDVLHIYGGVIFFLLWCLIFKHKYKFVSLFIIGFTAISNELFDLIYYYDKLGHYRWLDSSIDIVNTLLLPIIFFIFLKRFTKFYSS